MSIKFVLTGPMLLLTILSFSQGKYVEVVAKKGDYTGTYFGVVQPLNNEYSVNIPYKGKSKKAILQGILNYIKARPVLRFSHMSDNGSFVRYRDFSTIGNVERCGAAMVARTFVTAVPEEGMVLVNLNYGGSSKIYASLFDAKLSISVDDIVVADDDVPFNEYQMVQPPNELGVKMRAAYPESIFDAKGKVVNPTNKKILEDFYDFYITDLKNYLDKNLK